MIHVSIVGETQNSQFEHQAGPLEIGRGPQREAKRLIVTDRFVSRDQLRLSEIGPTRIRVENLSQTRPILVGNGALLETEDQCELNLPVHLTIGKTHVRIRHAGSTPADQEKAEVPAPQEAKTVPEMPVNEPPPAEPPQAEPPTKDLAAAEPSATSRAAGVEPQPATAPLAPSRRTLSAQSPSAQCSDAAGQSVSLPLRGSGAPNIGQMGDSPDAQTLAHWFETVISVQQAAAGSEEFYHETARAVVDLVGLDRGLVLLREDDDWKVVAMCATDDRVGANYSRGILDEVYQLRQTVYRNLDKASLTESLAHIDAVVAAPVREGKDRVVGVVYGSRTRGSAGGQVEIRPLEAQVVQLLAAAVAAGLARKQQQAEALRSQIQFEQFFSPQLAQELQNDAGLLEGRERGVTILFSDLRDFSGLSERLGPRETFRLMQDVMELQSGIIRQHEGVVVDYYGDGLLAMWNAPQDQADHAQRACRAALAILAQLAALNERWAETLAEPLTLGIGINTGPALVGNTGSRVKFKYGPMGPTVNLASRVEGATKPLGVSVVITGSTRSALSEPLATPSRSLATRRLCKAKLVGTTEAVELFELGGEKPQSQWIARRDAYEAALEHYESGRWAEACKAIYPLLSNETGSYDSASLNLLSRAVDCLKSPPVTFDPVMVFEHK